MALHPLSVRKLIKTVFCSDSPLTYHLVNDQQKQEKLIQISNELKPMMSGFNKMKFDTDVQQYTETRPLLLISYASRHESTFYYSWLEDDTLSVFFKGNQLFVTSAHVEAPLSRLDEIVEYFKNVDLKRDQQDRSKSKSKKLKHLKEQTILSKIQTLSKELDFYYRIDKYHTKLKLSVRLGENHMMEINIPYNKFQEILQELEDSIKSVMTLYNKGLRFKILGNKHDAYYWHKPGTK